MTRSHYDESESGNSTAAKNFKGTKFESDDEFQKKNIDFKKSGKSKDVQNLKFRSQL